MFQVYDGCDCCDLDGELVEDGFTWTKDDNIYGMGK